MLRISDKILVYAITQRHNGVETNVSHFVVVPSNFYSNISPSHRKVREGADYDTGVSDRSKTNLAASCVVSRLTESVNNPYKFQLNESSQNKVM
jgi:hypothetical protein